MTIGSRIRELRLQLGLSQSELAAELCRLSRRDTVTRETISRWESGKREPRSYSLRYLAEALGTDVTALTGHQGDPLRIAHEWLVTESPQTLEVRSGRRVGSGLAEQLERRVIELRHLDDQLAGKDLAPVAAKELRETDKLIKGASYSDAIGRRLLTAFGELAQLAGWVASDAGLHTEAQRFYLSGVAAASQAANRALAGNLLSSLSYQIANVANPTDALLMARTAEHGAHESPPAVKALLLERVAWAAARSRKPDLAARVLDQVDDIFESRSSGDDEPEWVYWLTRDEVDTMRARCAVELGDPNTAERLLVPVLSRYPAQSERESALYWSWLAEAYAKEGELDQARATLGTVRGFAESIRSQRVDDRIAAVEELLTA